MIVIKFQLKRWYNVSISSLFSQNPTKSLGRRVILTIKRQIMILVGMQRNIGSHLVSFSLFLSFLFSIISDRFSNSLSFIYVMPGNIVEAELLSTLSGTARNSALIVALSSSSKVKEVELSILSVDIRLIMDFLFFKDATF